MKKTGKPKDKVKTKISRKEMIKKLGFGTFSAATMMLLLNEPAKADSGGSPDNPPDWVNDLSDSEIQDIINDLEAKKKAKTKDP